MRKLLLGTSALIGATALVASASAAPELTISGSLDFRWVGGEGQRTAPGATTDQGASESGWTFGNADSKSEIVFHAEAESDGGTSYGFNAQYRYLANTTDEAYIFVAGDWGTVHLGQDDGAFSARSVGATSVGTGGYFLDGTALGLAPMANFAYNDENKITYFSPDLSGFQFAITALPSDAAGPSQAAGPAGATPNAVEIARYNAAIVAAAANAVVLNNNLAAFVGARTQANFNAAANANVALAAGIDGTTAVTAVAPTAAGPGVRADAGVAARAAAGVYGNNGGGSAVNAFTRRAAYDNAVVGLAAGLNDPAGVAYTQARVNAARAALIQADGATPATSLVQPTARVAYEDVYQVGVSYTADFGSGSVTVSGAYQTADAYNENGAGNGDRNDLEEYSVGILVNFGALSFGAAYNNEDDSGLSDVEELLGAEGREYYNVGVGYDLGGDMAVAVSYAETEETVIALGRATEQEQTLLAIDFQFPIMEGMVGYAGIGFSEFEDDDPITTDDDATTYVIGTTVSF